MAKKFPPVHRTITWENTIKDMMSEYSYDFNSHDDVAHHAAGIYDATSKKLMHAQTDGTIIIPKITQTQNIPCRPKKCLTNSSNGCMKILLTPELAWIGLVVVMVANCSLRKNS